MLQFVAQTLIGIVLSMGTPTHAPRHNLSFRSRPVPVHRQTAQELYYSRSEDWDCYRRGRDTFTRCESTFPAGSKVTVLLDRVVEVQ